MYILGLSSYYHDSAAVLLKDGIVVCALEEERLTRKKHDNSFPKNAAKYCLDYAGISIKKIDAVAYYEKPLLKFERILETCVQTYPRSFLPFIKSIPEWLGTKIKVGKTIHDTLGYNGEIFYIPHHLSHAAAAYLPSSFSESAILTIDGVGDYPTTGLWKAKSNQIVLLKKIDFPDSLGLLYSTFTSFLGFRVNNDEYKVMGLAAYGNPRFKKKIESLIDVKEDGSFKLDMSYFAFRESFRMWSDRFEKNFGMPRVHGTALTKRDKDLAASLQSVTEDIYFQILNHLYEISGSKNLCVGGGVALNSLANGKIYKNTPFRKVYILGAAGDSGGALGSAIYLYNNVLGNGNRKKINISYFGGSQRKNEIKKTLDKEGLSYTYIKSKNRLLDITAQKLSENKIADYQVVHR